METTLHNLGRILLNGLPTFFLVLFLHFYLKYVFFKPLGRVLQARYEASEGARKAAGESIRHAEERIAEYQAKLRDARAEIYREQEVLFKRIQEEQAAGVDAARKESETRLNQAKVDLATETKNAIASLGAESERLAGEIAAVLLRGRAA